MAAGEEDEPPLPSPHLSPLPLPVCDRPAGSQSDGICADPDLREVAMPLGELDRGAGESGLVGDELGLDSPLCSGSIGLPGALVLDSYSFSQGGYRGRGGAILSRAGSRASAAGSEAGFPETRVLLNRRLERKLEERRCQGGDAIQGNWRSSSSKNQGDLQSVCGNANASIAADSVPRVELHEVNSSHNEPSHPINHRPPPPARLNDWFEMSSGTRCGSRKGKGAEKNGELVIKDQSVKDPEQSESFKRRSNVLKNQPDVSHVQESLDPFPPLPSVQQPHLLVGEGSNAWSVNRSSPCDVPAATIGAQQGYS